MQADQLINSFLEAGLYRYGGDEFIIILNVETEQEYKKQLEEFCNQFLANSYQEFDMLITLSIGYTVLFENQLYLENFKHLLDTQIMLYIVQRVWEKYCFYLLSFNNKVGGIFSYFIMHNYTLGKSNQIIWLSSSAVTSKFSAKASASPAFTTSLLIITLPEIT